MAKKINCQEILGKEIYTNYHRYDDSHRKWMQRHGYCRCPRYTINTCNSDCLCCQYHIAGETLSLDAPVRCDDSDIILIDTIYDDTMDVQAVVESHEISQVVHTAIATLESEEQKVVNLVLTGRTEREISKVLGYPHQSSVNNIKKRAFQKLRTLLTNYKDYL